VAAQLSLGGQGCGEQQNEKDESACVRCQHWGITNAMGLDGQARPSSGTRASSPGCLAGPDLRQRHRSWRAATKRGIPPGNLRRCGVGGVEVLKAERQKTDARAPKTAAVAMPQSARCPGRPGRRWGRAGRQLGAGVVKPRQALARQQPLQQLLAGGTVRMNEVAQVWLLHLPCRGGRRRHDRGRQLRRLHAQRDDRHCP
jgi:hypothetical protein